MSSPDKSARRGRFDAVVEENRLMCREHYYLRLRVKGGFPSTFPGQFIQLGCRTPDVAIDAQRLQGATYDWQPGRPAAVQQMELLAPTALLRRPFSLAGRGDDGDGTWLSVVHRVVGQGTAWLSRLAAGDPVDLIGPLGNRFVLPDGKSIGLLVGGGVGLPPMFYLAEAIREAGWRGTAVVGALRRDLLAVTWRGGEVVEFQGQGVGVAISTDDGSLGVKGRVTDALLPLLAQMSESERSQAVVFTCGPERMMKAVSELADRYDVACQVCMEQAMACGMGTCQSCIVRIEADDEPHGHTGSGRAWRYRLACTDGPVFDAKQVVWDVD